MNSKGFIIADVFTQERFCGNQLAVFTDGAGLDSATMQNIAREMNYSETTFLLPPEAGGDYRIRIFTPAKELPFAGHPLVGSANVIVAEGMKRSTGALTTVRLETGVGEIVVEVKTEGGRAGHTTMTQPLPLTKGTFADVDAMAKALSIDASDIQSTDLPIEAIYNGITVVIVPIASRKAIERIQVDGIAIGAIVQELGAETVLAFTRETVAESSSVHCRVFAPGAGVGEDAATGSANGPLGFYLVKHGLVRVEPRTRILSEQGCEMKRPSQLHIEIDVDAGSDEVTGVRVGGGVVIAGRGEIFLS
ncbi:MAG TPA: PhzF family phenazine biosynthesis protein [Blastocatellia bacterium]|nr:PhzF family phenazine biosynthesis protein [Blastocatellia bacterium]